MCASEMNLFKHAYMHISIQIGVTKKKRFSTKYRTIELIIYSSLANQPFTRRSTSALAAPTELTPLHK